MEDQRGFARSVFNNADDHEADKLFKDLIQERKDNALFTSADIPDSEQKLLDECQKIADRLLSSNIALAQVDFIRQSMFNSACIDQQVAQMHASIDFNPTDAIGKAKELLESVKALKLHFTLTE